MLSFWRSAIEAVGAVIYPQICLGCGSTTPSRQHILCVSCASSIKETGASGKTSDVIFREHQLLDLSLFQKGGSLFFFDMNGANQHLIHQLKYLKREQVGVWMGQLLASRYDALGFFDDIDALVPLPIHPKRQKERGYNQSQVIASGIGQTLHLPVVSDLVVRSKYTKPQATIHSQSERDSNIRDAFRLAPECGAFEHKHLLVIDDVLTTGATLSACSRTLSHVQGVRLSFLTFAITVTQ